MAGLDAQVLKVTVTSVDNWDSKLAPRLANLDYSRVVDVAAATAKRILYGRYNGPLSGQVYHNGMEYYGVLVFEKRVVYLQVDEPVNLLRLFTDHGKVTGLTVDVIGLLMSYLSGGQYRG